MSVRTLKDSSIDDELKKQLKRLTTGMLGMMWYRLEYDKTINAVLLYEKKKIIGWSLIDKGCATEPTRTDVHVFVHKKHRGKGHGTYLRDKAKSQFEKIFKKFYYYDYKKKDYVKF